MAQWLQDGDMTHYHELYGHILTSQCGHIMTAQHKSGII